MYPIAALFIITRTWKQPRCPSADEWIRKLWYIYRMEYSVQFSCSVMSNSLQPHESQHTRAPCPSPTPRVHSNSRPSIRCPKINILNKPRRQFVYKWFLQTEELVKASSFSVILLPIHRRPRAYSSLFWLPWRPPILAGMCRPT